GRVDQINSNQRHQPTVIVGGKYQVEFKDWQSGMTTIDQLVDKVQSFFSLFSNKYSENFTL
ncbi:hypothetical protein G0017_10590, partial [Neisseria meningitidis]|nr:hypothetical protein [Neisseria meningitidis]